MSNRDFEDVIRTLLDDDSGLSDLAEKSGFDPFNFYQGADLSGLDLSGQDLTGLNFGGANLQESRLEGVRYDIGAFNGAILDDKYADKKDAYDIFIDDVFSATRYGLYFFGRFRPKSLEIGIDATNWNYGEFAAQARLNPQTLRKARRSGVVAGETVESICAALVDGWGRTGARDIFGDTKEVRQPFVELLDLTHRGFEHISRAEFVRVYRSKIMEEQESGPLSPAPYRSSFSMEKVYLENEYIVVQSLPVFVRNG